MLDADSHARLQQLLPDGLQHRNMRITANATLFKMIQSALEHLQVSAREDQSCIGILFTRIPHQEFDAPLVLHTLPGSSSAPTQGPSTSTQPSNAAVPAPNPDAPAITDETLPENKVRDSSSLALPKLVSIVEIIKRKYNPALLSTNSDATSKRKQENRRGRSIGLHQYTYLGCMEDLGTIGGQVEESEEAKRARIEEMWLHGGAGRNKRYVSDLL